MHEEELNAQQKTTRWEDEERLRRRRPEEEEGEEESKQRPGMDDLLGDSTYDSTPDGMQLAGILSHRRTMEPKARKLSKVRAWRSILKPCTGLFLFCKAWYRSVTRTPVFTSNATFVVFVQVHVGFSASRVPAEGALGLNAAPEDGEEEEQRREEEGEEESKQRSGMDELLGDSTYDSLPDGMQHAGILSHR